MTTERFAKSEFISGPSGEFAASPATTNPIEDPSRKFTAPKTIERRPWLPKAPSRKFNTGPPTPLISTPSQGGLSASSSTHSRRQIADPSREFTLPKNNNPQQRPMLPKAPSQRINSASPSPTNLIPAPSQAFSTTSSAINSSHSRLIPENRVENLLYPVMPMFRNNDDQCCPKHHPKK